ncbi:MAG: hypothetical protein A2W35_01425 [Chloroflexi bacterium RBG_16_57_11]|nr:MAG: hypothetical protein A2W35_01425 [Chloroflexi bacterium RBG_16_57_11]
MKESPIFTRTYDLLLWLIPLTIKFPRSQRFVLAEAVQHTALTLQEQLIDATGDETPRLALRQADITLTKLRTYLRLCKDLKLVSFDQYEYASVIVNEIGRLLGGWMKSV